MTGNSGLKSTTFNDNLSMKFYKYKKKKIPSKFSIFLKVMEFRLNNLKCSSMHYGMIMLMIKYFFG